MILSKIWLKGKNETWESNSSTVNPQLLKPSEEQQTDLWFIMTAFGFPVVPDVKDNVKISLPWFFLTYNFFSFPILTTYEYSKYLIPNLVNFSLVSWSTYSIKTKFFKLWCYFAFNNWFHFLIIWFDLLQYLYWFVNEACFDGAW